MADERKCYAGDLSSDALGKTIRFQLRTPTKDVREVLVVEVTHRKSEGQEPVTIVDGIRDGERVAHRLPVDFIVEVLP